MKKAVQVIDIKIGSIYRHFKGCEYVVVGLCRIESDLQTGVLYKAVNQKVEDITWMTPLENFRGNVLENGERIPRFKFVEETQRQMQMLKTDNT